MNDPHVRALHYAVKQRHAQAENFADSHRQHREIEREHMREITQRKIEAWQKEQKEQKEKAGDGASRGPRLDPKP
ncbi:MAG TPA: hypothetical protein VM141_08085 [Planctomycetota bacterium]|nr:hypothetical protein [Planctomycetota bacterium]